MVRTYPHFNPFSVINTKAVDWQELFGNYDSLDLEIGCSNGRWMFEYAKRFPDRNIVGVETRNKYVEAVKCRIENRGLPNIAVVRGNINRDLDTLFPGNILKDVFIMFPDPWYKKKHLNRRVVTPLFLDDLYEHMVIGGELHVATDKESFAYEMLDVLQMSKFKNKALEFVDHNIEGIITEIEEFNVAKGKRIYRMIFNK